MAPILSKSSIAILYCSSLGAAVPARLVFHKRNALALNAFGNNSHRHPFYFPGFLKGSLQRIKIIDITSAITWKLKGFKFFINRIRRAYIGNIAVNLKSVIISNNNRLSIFWRLQTCSLPHLAFLNFPVAKQRINPERLFAKLCRVWPCLQPQKFLAQ